MEKQIITFSANEQCLQKTGGVDCYASNTVAYIEAHFDLGDNWSGYDSVRAVWFTDFVGGISTVLDSQGVCVVPFEVLTRKSEVKVNLVGSIADGDVLADRLTTCPVVALTIKCNAKVDGDNEQPITPSQFEQFVAQVISEVEKVTGMTAEAETLPSGSQATARYENGKLYIGIPQGEQGESGVGIASVTLNADYTLTITMTDGASITTTSIRGERGEKGETGADGITPSISIGNVETLEPDEDAYVTRRGTDAEPIFDFGIPKGDKGEDAVIPWDSILPVDTASGEIVTITDGTDLVPAKSLKVALEPIQSGSGTPSPDNVRPISGRTEVVTQRTGVNLALPINYNTNRFAMSEDGVFTQKNPSSASWGWSYAETFIRLSLKAGTYMVSFDAETLSTGVSAEMRVYSSSNTQLATTGTRQNGKRGYCSFTLTEQTDVGIVAKMYDGAWNFQLELGTTATAYEPYQGETYTNTLPETVYGGTLDVVSGELVVDRAIATITRNVYATNWFSHDASFSTWGFYCNNDTRWRDFIGDIPIGGLISDRLPTVSSAYGTDSTCCSLAITNGVMQYMAFRIPKTAIETPTDSADLSEKIKNWLDSNPIQVCFEIEPQTIQLTPQEVQLLLGNNNVWSDGDVTLTYSADIQRYIEKKLGTRTTLTMSRPMTAELNETETEETE